jgi:hypothetical protein
MNKNEEALWNFMTQLKSFNKLTGNKMTKFTEVHITYRVGLDIKEVDSKMMISFDNQPNATFELYEYGWMTAQEYYLGFDLGYNRYEFDPMTGILTMTCDSSPKLGGYKVEIRAK